MITITGASGQLGRLVVSKVLEKHPGERIVAAVRNRDKAQALLPRTVELRAASYDRPETLNAAFAGADKLLFISSSELGPRQPQHAAVIEAAQRAGATLLVYTSLLHADTSGLQLAVDHRATEQAVNKPVTLLSSDGAAMTTIDARNIDAQTNVLLITNGGRLGKPGKGFTVTPTRGSVTGGIVIDSNDVVVAGNHVTAVEGPITRSNWTGIVTVPGAASSPSRAIW